LSPGNVPPHEMGARSFDDDELDRLLGGHPQPTDQPDELDVFVRDLRSAFPTTPMALEDQHIAAMTDASRLLADKGDPVVRPASNADAPAPQVSWLPKRRRTDMKRLKPILTKGLAPVFALLTIFSGMAYAGVLPAPVQNAVAGFVGADQEDTDDPTTDGLVDDETIDVDDDEPSDDQGEDGDLPGKDDGEANDDQGDDGDGQGEDADDEGDVEGDADDQGEDGDDPGDDGDHRDESDEVQNSDDEPDDDSDAGTDEDADIEPSGDEE